MADNIIFALNEARLSSMDGLGLALKSYNQGAVAISASLLGALLAARGFAAIKFLFVFSFSLAVTLRTCLLAEQEGQPALGVALALVVLPCAVLVADRLYLVFCFSVGAGLGGTAAFACLRGLISSPALLIGLSVLASLVSGLMFLRWRNVGWRLLTAPVGALLLAASLRYGFACVVTGGALWLDFTGMPWANSLALVSDPLAVCFLCAWGVFAQLGWYAQLASLLGMEDPLALPEHIARVLEKSQESIPFAFDLDAFKESSVARRPDGFAEEREPFLDMSVPEARDWKPEVLLLLSAVAVVLLCSLLCSRPLLVLGHVALMSCATTAGFLTFSVQPATRPPSIGQFGNRAFLGLSLALAAAGYLCMYLENRQSQTSHLGLSAEGTPDRIRRVLHVWLGYAALGLLLVLTATAAAKSTRSGEGGSRAVSTTHRVLGKVVSILAAATQILGYFIEGLLPFWAPWLLTSLLLAGLLALLPELQGKRSVSVRVDDQAHHEQPSLAESYRPPGMEAASTRAPGEPAVDNTQAANFKREVSFASTKVDSGRSQPRSSSDTPKSPRSPGIPKKVEVEERVLRRENSTDRLAWALLRSLRERRQQALLALYFGRWQSRLLATRLCQTSIETAESNNLADFLSAGLVSTPRASAYQSKGAIEAM